LDIGDKQNRLEMHPRKQTRKSSSIRTDQLKSECDSYDNRLAILRQEMNDVQKRRNMLTLINVRLPPEMLCKIFYYIKL
jgi:hypothetical protein